MKPERSRSIKQAQRESLIYQELSKFMLQIILDDPRVAGLTVNRVALTKDGGTCFVYFYTAEGKEVFDQKMPFLIMYKPSLRKALSQKLSTRYVPELNFKFDDQFEKQQRIEELLDQVKEEDE